MRRIAARRRTRAASYLALAALLLSVGAEPSTPARRADWALVAPPVAAAAAPEESAATAPGEQPAPTRVRYATQLASAGAALYVAQDRGYFQQEGIDLDFVPFTNNSEMVPS